VKWQQSGTVGRTTPAAPWDLIADRQLHLTYPSDHVASCRLTGAVLSELTKRKGPAAPDPFLTTHFQPLSLAQNQLAQKRGPGLELRAAFNRPPHFCDLRSGQPAPPFFNTAANRNSIATIKLCACVRFINSHPTICTEG
jgi:hypothetical protein